MTNLPTMPAWVLEVEPEPDDCALCTATPEAGLIIDRLLETWIPEYVDTIFALVPEADAIIAACVEAGLSACTARSWIKAIADDRDPEVDS